ncbi:MAG: class A beta-lactamase-related serine hydrolase [Gemmataceae bacterium]|nr:class A beta-lactamase-related serine hydrolase [Gemmataceae bacterium]
MSRRVSFLFLLVCGSFCFSGETPAGPSVALVPFIETGSVAGAVTLVADKEKVLSLEAIGYSDVKSKTPIKTDAVFWIASMSKPITGVGLMMLVDEGKVKLDDPVEKYLPEFKDMWVAVEKDKDHMLLKRPKSAITVRQLMDHTSGMPFRSAMEEPTLDRLTLRDAIKSYVMTPLQTEPGTKYAYSNAGINSAGRIIEVVSKMPYEQFMDKRVFEPLGMKDTTFWPNASQVARLAHAYKPAADKLHLEETNIAQLTYPLSNRTRQPMPAGGLFSTAEDVGTLCRMVLNVGTKGNVRFLSEDAIKEMSKRSTPPELKESYGIGWSVSDGWFGHGGALATDMQINTKQGLILVYLVQHAGFPNDGSKGKAAFQQAAIAKFGKPR